MSARRSSVRSLVAPLPRGEDELCCAAERVARLQLGAGKIRVVWRVGEVLRLKAKAAALHIFCACLSGPRAVEKVPAVELDSRLGSEDFQHTAVGWIEHLGRGTQRASRAADNEVVIVAAGAFELFVLLVNAFVDTLRRGEVERRSSNCGELAGRNQRRVDGRV